ncbi:hypothetical protein [Streptomyces paromomycinus]|uniref:Chromosome partition protein Smc n=1 Tax=Streptomyces paromomycinus TaxID=92743 RepID=A0A401VU94_STREY|nr:hypothetical protein [Streptomyces paromomycinus]GCD40593.1 chromosome partition protein Smc [Streptomyces paromomycinus]
MTEAAARGTDQDALHALRWSLEWAAQAVARLAGEAPEDVATEAVFLLDDAIGSASGLTGAVPSLLRAARPGPDVVSYLREGQQELTDLGAKVRELRHQLDELAGTRSDLDARLADMAGLRAQVAEVRRLERLVEALEDVQEQRDVLDTRLTLLRERADGTEEAVRLGSGELLRLSEERLTRLATPVRQALERAAEAQRDLTEAEGQLAGAEEAATEAAQRTDQVRAERERLAQLTTWARINHRIVVSLAEYAEPGNGDDALAQITDALGTVESRLGELDAALAGALDAHDQEVSAGRSLVAWSDEGPATHPAR